MTFSSSPQNSNFLSALVRASIRLLALACLPLSLDGWSGEFLSAYRYALDYDSVYASSGHALAAGRQKEPQGFSTLLPVVGLTANTTDNHANVNYREPTFYPSGYRSFNTSGYVVSLNQPLFRWQNWETYQQTKLLVSQAEANYAQAGQDLVIRTAQAYFDVLAARDMLEVTQAQKEAIARQLAQAKRSFELGAVTVVDSKEAQSRHDLAAAAELAAQSDLEVKRAALQQIIGKPVSGVARFRPDAKIASPQPAALDQWVAASMENNYAVKAQEAAAEAARRDIAINQAGHLPTVDLVASRTIANATGSTTLNVGSDITQNAIGVQLAVPIFSGGMTTAKVREASALYDKARSDLETQRRAATQAARQAFVGLSTGLAQIDAYEVAVESSKSSLDSNKRGYELGVRINIDVLNAQQQFFQARQNLAKARYDTILSALKLKGSSGSLTIDDIVTVDALFSDPAEVKQKLSLESPILNLSRSLGPLPMADMASAKRF